jgi:hypothetical protein
MCTFFCLFVSLHLDSIQKIATGKIANFLAILLSNQIFVQALQFEICTKGN